MVIDEKSVQHPPPDLAEDMSAVRVEVDAENTGEGDLPTYAELQQAAPPNSRFGRWREWIDKRSAERFADQTPEERRARQERLGWGENLVASPTDVSPQADEHIASSSFQPTPPELQSPPSYPQPPRLGDPLPPTQAALYTFGSRFLSHSRHHICCLLPVARDHFLLIGTTEGLSVLNVLPRLHGEEPLGVSAGLDGAKTRELWRGCGVVQAALLEDASGIMGGDPDQGIVLALVTTTHYDATGRCETVRQLRMYKLSSLVSLIKWTVTQKECVPIELPKSASWDSPSTKKQRNRLSNLINLLAEGPDHAPRPSSPQPASPSRSQSVRSRPQPPVGRSSWDNMDDLPLQWATDYQPFQHPKIAGANVLFFELWKSDDNGNYGRTMLAVGTPKSIVLFEAPRGERAFTFVKDYYTPHPPKSAKFIHQAVPETTSPAHHHTLSSHSKESMRSEHGSIRSTRIRRISLPGQTTPQLSLFITFEKKAVVVRLSDAAVGEVDVYSDGGPADLSPTHSLSGHGNKLHKHNSDAGKESRPLWAPLVPLYLPIPTPLPSTSQYYAPPPERVYYLITRGNHTYAYPTPLPIPVSVSQASYVHTWTAPPNQVAGRVILGPDGAANLQLISFGNGVEIQEIPVADIISGQQNKSLGRAAGKLRSPTANTRCTIVHEGFPAGYLCSGGEWNRLAATGNAWRLLSTRPPVQRNMSDDSLDDRSRVSDAGVYAWIQKDVEDYRVFWLGSKDSDV
ncbi:hypothetical protein DACRYDRAFT_113210 [Dacryopinax primogenitus]|uniref:Uncharacterized protein n=1 Tax=Dacryopinax primogenitus (strain DJM 731) TaxID=1858805 RepID=M5G8I4_DACPD|nr:uncharacterized protein DACRYDRAFT_113210 [Dacryopinax primogenitus]EJU06526.1 hypothetical protein DACRYDRAFT_113210 [Dacryopinax primogenitus]